MIQLVVLFCFVICARSSHLCLHVATKYDLATPRTFFGEDDGGAFLLRLLFKRDDFRDPNTRRHANKDTSAAKSQHPECVCAPGLRSPADCLFSLVTDSNLLARIWSPAGGIKLPSGLPSQSPKNKIKKIKIATVPSEKSSACMAGMLG